MSGKTSLSRLNINFGSISVNISVSMDESGGTTQGRALDKNSEEWRRICEATSTLKTPLQQRRKYLDLVQKHRGHKARLELEAEMVIQFNILKGKKDE